MPKVFRLFFVCLTLSIFFVFPARSFAVKQFIEDFNDGNANGWVVVNDPAVTPCSAPWTVQNGRMKISINQPFCTTNIMPNDELWDDLGNDYIFELDMTLVAGTDHNVAFRFTHVPGESYNNWYDIHITSSTLPPGFWLERIPPPPWVYFTPYPLQNREAPYHFKIVVESGNIEVYIDGDLAVDHEYDPSIDLFPTGRIALRAGTGADSTSVTYFDNIVVTSLEEEGLDVPYFSQNDEVWSDDIYDSLDATIGEVGCALSSAAMVLNYYGINQLPDGSSLDVGTLNQWLNDNPDGMWRHGLTSWPALSRLSRLMHEMDESYPILDYRKIKPPDFGEIDQILTVEEDPLIFEEIKPLSPSGVHFTTATGMNTSGSDYFLLDPLDQSRNHFLIPPDQLVSARYLFPTATNLSYLILHSDLGLNGLLTNPNSSRLGRNEAGEEFDEIWQANFSQQYPLLYDDDHVQTTGEVFWEYSIPDPVSGDYDLQFTADESGWYEFELYAYDRDANPTVFKKKVYVDSDYPTLYALEYNQDGGEGFAVLNKIVIFETLANDVGAMWDEGEISADWTKTSLLRMLRQAERYYPGNLDRVRHFLNLFEKQLTNHYPEYISEQGYEFLLEELAWLRDSL